MFPRPSRVTRLSILAAAALCFIVFLYTLTPALVHSDRGAGFEPTTYFTTTQASSTQVLALNFTPRVVTEGLKDTYEAYKAALFEPPHPVNPHNFRYIHNPIALCRGQEASGNSIRSNRRAAEPSEGEEFAGPVTLLVYIHSAPGNLKKRQAVRQTWGHPTLLRRLDAAVVFVLGKPAMVKEQALLDLEAHEYGDLVQEDFLDAYRNLTYKGVSALRWVSLFCPSAVFLLKTDDDILVDIVSLVADLKKRYPSYRSSGKQMQQNLPPLPNKVVLCNLWTRMKVMRDPKSKWFIPPSEFAPDYFPPYCSGSAFLLSADLAPRLYRVSLDKPFFWVDDYYVTGILVNSLGLKHLRYNDVYLLNANLAEGQLANDAGKTLFFHVKKLALFLKLWPMLLQRHVGIPEVRNLIPTTHNTPSSIVGEAPTQPPPGGRQVVDGQRGDKNNTSPATSNQRAHTAPAKSAAQKATNIPTQGGYLHVSRTNSNKPDPLDAPLSRDPSSANQSPNVTANRSPYPNNEDKVKHSLESSHALLESNKQIPDTTKKIWSSLPSTRQKVLNSQHSASGFSNGQKPFSNQGSSQTYHSNLQEKMNSELSRGLTR